MPKKGENIYKRKDGRWEGRYICSHDVSGKAKYGYIYGKTYREVKQKLLRLKVMPLQRSEKNDSQVITFSQLLDDWLRSSRLNIKESTYARYFHLIEKHIKPRLGDCLLWQLTTQTVEDFIASQLQNGRLDGQGGLSSKTATDILTVIKSATEYAQYNNYEIGCNLKKLSVKKKEKEMRVLTPTEQTALIKTLTTEMDLCKFGVILSLYTGIRIGELCALTWEDLILSESVLKVRKTMQRIQDTELGAIRKTKIIITEPKSKCSVREIPLPPFIVDMAHPFSSSPQAFVLTGDTKRFMSFDAFVCTGCESASWSAYFQQSLEKLTYRSYDFGSNVKHE